MSCCFTVEGIASPDLPLRILNLFAQQALVLDAVEIVRTDDLHRIRVTGELPAECAAIILEKIRMLVLVTHAALDQ